MSKPQICHLCHLAICEKSSDDLFVQITNLISLDSFLKKQAAARAPIARWLAVAQSQNWATILEIRASLPNADAIKGIPYTCFNVGGNSFRLMTIVSYRLQQVHVVELLTHSEYSRKSG